MSTSPAPAPPPRGGIGSLDANLRAFLALVIPPVSSLAAWRLWGGDRLVRHHAVQGTVFGFAVLLGIAAFKFFAPRAPAAPAAPSPGMVLVAFLLPLFNLCCALAWVGQMVTALARRRWFVPVIAPLTRRLLRAAGGRA